jgi:hypothetical protein
MVLFARGMEALRVKRQKELSHVSEGIDLSGVK